MRKKTNEPKDTWQVIWFGIKEAIDLSKAMIAVWSLISVASAIVPLIMLQINAKVVDALSGQIQTGSFRRLLILMLVFGGAYLFEQIYRLFLNIISDIMQLHYNPILHEKFISRVQNLNLRTLEKGEYNDNSSQFHGTVDKLIFFIKDGINFIVSCITTIGLFVITIYVKWYFGIIALLIIGIRFYVAGKILGQEQDFWNDIKRLRRKAHYFFNLSTDYHKAKEIRMLSMEPLLRKNWMDAEKTVLQRRNQIDEQRNFLNAICSGMDSLFTAFLLILCATLLKDQKITIGTMILMSSTVLRLFGSISSASTSLGVVFQKLNDLRIHKMVYDLCSKEQNEPVVKNTRPGNEKQTKPYQSDTAFSLRDLSFGYGTKPILDNLSINFERGKIIALCGDNGAGKTTLVKILLGLYAPDRGDVTFKGYSYEDLERAEINNSVGMAMQRYSIYNYAFRDNIAYSLVGEIDRDEVIWEAAEKAGVASLIRSIGNKGLDQQIIKWCNDDGVELSWGQKQKLAVARAHMGDREILILDEPASQLDPIAEYLQFMKVRELCKGTTAILISHRIGFARLADEIIVLKDGKVHEQGNHEQLMTKQGEYYAMFNAQAQWYQKVEIDNYSEEV
ncbi:MAG: hypothetical protein BGN88_05525 [Clostridiales bacterium 43-6]|nr:MAG: hypothetical protein BGN88_05525 [Clostridiales bacterium 43-6]